MLTSVFKNQSKNKQQVATRTHHIYWQDKTSLSVDQEDLKHGLCATKKPNISEKDKGLEDSEKSLRMKIKLKF